MDPYAITGKKILFAPLNWGLGHASRSAKLIDHLKESNSITIASDGNALEWLRKEFPELPSLELPELNMKYSKRFGAIGGIIRKLPHFINSIKRDNNFLKEFGLKNEFDLIISDNRYGFYHRAFPSILISHQLKLLNPLSFLLSMPLQNLIEKFDELWVPDDDKHSLSGELSIPENPLLLTVNFIGSLSRFTFQKDKKKDIKFLLIASGPEPFRQDLVSYFHRNFNMIDEICHIVSGVDLEEQFLLENKLTIHSSLNSNELEDLIDRSEYVICRSGYSSIMDLIKKQQKAILIPTPGQSEQKYLAELHKDNNLFECVLKYSDLPRIMKKLL